MRGKNGKPSLSAIAREIGLSTATLSRVLNGRPGIAEKTRKRVLKELERRGYPNTPVHGGWHSLRNGGSTIAFAITDKIQDRIEKGDPFYGRHLLAIQAACSDKGYYPVLINYDQETTENGSLRCVEEQRVHGIIAEDMSEEMIERLRDKIGVVLLNLVRPIKKVDYVIPNVRQAAREQVEYLYSCGHRNIACFRPLPVKDSGWQTHLFWSEYWWMSKRLELELPSEYFEPIRFSINGEGEAVEQFMRRLFSCSRPPSAILTGDNYVGVIKDYCARKGIRVPEDLSLMGYDDRQYLPGADNVSTYRQNFKGMAREALRLLLDRCQNLDLYGRIVEVEGTMVHRESVVTP